MNGRDPVRRTGALILALVTLTGLYPTTLAFLGTVGLSSGGMAVILLILAIVELAGIVIGFRYALRK